MTADLGRRAESLQFLLHDRDGKYGQSFDAVSEAEDMEILKNAPRTPRTNAHRERVIGNIRREALDHVLIMNEARARARRPQPPAHPRPRRRHQRVPLCGLTCGWCADLLTKTEKAPLAWTFVQSAGLRHLCRDDRI
ncbi:hypothetical protein ACFV6F_09070 [Kitasatospora phosalacinea]|uniref:hypothetical protein n=1 Tax=Kitasatospora phosalacinea TaxID=2065 RepID=UPI0036620318